MPDQTGDARDAFTLDPAVAHLNHGAYGAVPRAVQRDQQRLREAAESNPHRFHRVEVAEGVVEARRAAAAFLGLGVDDVILVRNVTEAIGTVLASSPLRAGDEVVVSDHGYGSVALAVGRWCERAGGCLRLAEVPIDATPDVVVAAYESVLGERTRLVVVDQITSPTGMLLPAVSVTAAAHRHGAAAFVDAAHVPGHVDLAVADCGADFWVGNFHKWAYAPRGTAAFWVAPSWRDRIAPLVTGWNHGLSFPLPFDDRGTDDYTAWMCLPQALAIWSELGGWAIPRANAALVDAGLAYVSGALDVPLTCLPVHPAPALRLLPLPDGVVHDLESAQVLYETLSTQHRVEAAVVGWRGRGFIRLTAQVYNTMQDYERLAAALLTALRRSPAQA